MSLYGLRTFWPTERLTWAKDPFFQENRLQKCAILILSVICDYDKLCLLFWIVATFSIFNKKNFFM